MAPGRGKQRLTISLDPEVARALRADAAARELSVSRVAEEALRRLLLRSHQEALEKLSDQGGCDGGTGNAEEVEIVAWMSVELFRHQFPASRDISDEELRRRAVAARGRRS